MSDYTKITSEIINRLGGVRDIGQVHDYARYAFRPEDLKDIFLDNEHGDIRCWYIDRVSVTDTQSSNTTNTVVHRFKLTGFLSVQDTKRSGVEFQEIIDRIRDAFTPQTNLSDTRPDADVCELTRPIQFENIGFAILKGDKDYPCHWCEAFLEVQTYTTS